MWGERVLVVVAHPDDETIGAGGTLARCAGQGVETAVLILTRCDVARYGGLSLDAATDRRRNEASTAAFHLGIRHLWWGEFPEIRLPLVPHSEVVGRVREILDVLRPDTILTHWWGELNVDHQCVSEAVQVAARPFTAPAVSTLLAFQVDPFLPPWPGGFRPSRFVPLSSDHMARKVAAIGAYASEAREAPHPRSLENIRRIAETTGAMVGVPLAEAFEVVWEVER